MKELQENFKKLLSLETVARDLYLSILGQNIRDEEMIHKVELIKNQEIGHMFMAKELIKISARAESRKNKPYFSKETLKFLKGDIILKRTLLGSMVKLLDAKVRAFFLFGLLGKKAIKFKKADKTRQELTRVIAHELKTPLTTSNWISELFLRKNREKLTEDEKEMIGRIRAENKTMFSFIDDLLEVGRIEETEKIRKEDIDLVRIFQETIDELKYLIKNQRQKVAFRYFKDKIIVHGNEKLLKKIVSNLLSNAVNYGKNGSLISIKIEEAGAGKILFSVADNGIGIPEKEQKNIFKKFFRASNAKSPYQKGTGLGLYIVKELTKKLGGKVWFKSKEGAGATFYVELPT